MNNNNLEVENSQTKYLQKLQKWSDLSMIVFFVCEFNSNYVRNNPQPNF